MCWCFFLSNKTKRRIACFISEFICCWARVGVKIVETFEKIVCEVMPMCYFHVLDYFVAVFVLATTWVTKTIDWFVTWVLCLSYVGEGLNKIGNLFTNESRLLTLAPVVIVDEHGDSDWFIHVVVGNDTFILGTNGEHLIPQKVAKRTICDDGSKCSELSCKRRSPECESKCGECGEFIYVDADILKNNQKSVQGEPLMYYAEKVVEITDRLMSGTFADDDDSQSATDITQYSYATGTNDDEYNNNKVVDLVNSVSVKDLITVLNATILPTPNPAIDATAVEAMKFSDIIQTLGAKFVACVRYRDYGIRVLNKDSDNCDNSGAINCNVKLHCSGYKYVCNTKLVSMDRNYNFDINDYKFLMNNKNDTCNVLTVFFVNQYTEKDGDVSCAGLLGYVFCGFTNPDGSSRLLTDASPHTVPTMANIVGRFQSKKVVVGVAEDLIHSIGHQAGLMHTCEEVDDERLWIFGQRLQETRFVQSNRTSKFRLNTPYLFQYPFDDIFN